jgi:hypothetical protein
VEWLQADLQGQDRSEAFEKSQESGQDLREDHQESQED